MALHGAGCNNRQMIRYQGLTDFAERGGYIVAAPMGYRTRIPLTLPFSRHYYIRSPLTMVVAVAFEGAPALPPKSGSTSSSLQSESERAHKEGDRPWESEFP